MTDSDGRWSSAESGVWRTISRYAHYVDGADFVGLSALFAEDGELIIEGYDKPMGEPLRGRQSIREHLSRSAERRAADPLREALRRHHVSSVLVEVESETMATSTSYFIAITSGGADHWGRYLDQLRMEGSDWLFERRHVIVEGRRAI